MGTKIVLFLLGIGLFGCSLNANISNLNEDLPATAPTAPVEIQKMSSFESVSASTGYLQTAVSGYKVKQSAGLVINKQFAMTPKGYKVYLGALGRMTSEESSH